MGVIGIFQSGIGCCARPVDATESAASHAGNQPEIPAPCPFPLRVRWVGVSCIDGVGGGHGFQPATTRKATLAVSDHGYCQPAGQLRHAHQLLSPGLWALLHYGVNGHRCGFLRICGDVLAGYGEQRPSFHCLLLASDSTAVSRVVIYGYILPSPPHDVKQHGPSATTRLGIFLLTFPVQRLVFLCVHGLGATWVQSYWRIREPSKGHILVIRADLSDQLPPFRALVGYACLALRRCGSRRGGTKHCLGTMAPQLRSK